MIHLRLYIKIQTFDFVKVCYNKDLLYNYFKIYYSSLIVAPCKIEKHNTVNISQEHLNSIFKQISLGDKSAFEELYDKTYLPIYRFVSYFFRNPMDCEDVVAETFYNIWYNSARVYNAKNIRAYLYSIARYEVYRQLRENKQKQNISIDEMQIDIASRIKNADELLIENETLHLLTEAINSLPERCKLVYLLVREERLKYREVANMLSITEGTVKQQMHTATTRIREYIESQIPSLTLRRVEV